MCGHAKGRGRWDELGAGIDMCALPCVKQIDGGAHGIVQGAQLRAL